MITTDFSANATHAAEYGYQLAKHLKAGVFLFNSVNMPAEASLSGIAVWPQVEGDMLLDDSIDELKLLKAHLEHNDYSDTFRPPVNYLNEAGTVRQTINDSIISQRIDLVIAGTHKADGLSTFLLGNHTNELIEFCVKPLLVIPRQADFIPVKKIAFAIDFEQPENDLEQLYDLIEFARPLDAEILLTHIDRGEHHYEKCIEKFMVEISNKANYPKIYYRLIKKHEIETGLDWICKHGQIDILAMVHRKHDFFDSILKGSHTKKMAEHISIPLLVFPAG